MSSPADHASDHCPVCGAKLESDDHITACPVCQASLFPDPLSSLDGEQRRGLIELVENANERLAKAGAEGAEQSFSLGCLVAAFPGALVVVGLNLFGFFNTILMLISLVMVALFSVGIAALLALAARQRSTRRVYLAEVQPWLAEELARQGLAESQLDWFVSQNLPPEAPLRLLRLDPEQGQAGRHAGKIIKRTKDEQE